MPKITRLPDPIFWINTDTACYPRNHPDDEKGSPFYRFWLPAGQAYVTPPAHSPTKYDAVLEIIEPGDPIFAYEDKKGIVGMGIVKEKPSKIACADRVPVYPNPSEIVKSFAVDWDTDITYPATDIYRETRYVRGTLRQRNDDTLYALRARSQQWLLQEGYFLDKSSQAKLKSVENDQRILPKEREALTSARIGQGRFRTNLLKVEQRCRITGVSDPSYLIASHIKPWVLCEGDEHWDGNNGLFLAPHLDHLFDKGKISFDDQGTMLVSRFQNRDVLRAWALTDMLNVGPFNTEQCRYMAFHRTYIFERSRSWHQILHEKNPIL